MAAGFPPAEEGEAAGASHGLELVEVVGVKKGVAAVLWEPLRQVAESRDAFPEYLCSRQGGCGFASQFGHKLYLVSGLPRVALLAASRCFLRPLPRLQRSTAS